MAADGFIACGDGLGVPTGCGGKVGGYAQAVGVHFAQGEHGGGGDVVATRGGEPIPMQGLGVVLRCADAGLVEIAEPVLRCDVALVGGSLKLGEAKIASPIRFQAAICALIKSIKLRTLAFMYWRLT